MRFDISTRMGRLRAWWYAMLVEHNFTNVVRFNFHRITDHVYRSSQPTMSQLERYAKKHGIRTILNLKGCNPNSAHYALEVEKCRELGLNLVDINIASRRIPEPDKLRLAKETFERIEYPVWMHCKAGADRAGIYATLFQYFKMGIPIEQTDQLKLWPYGHFKYSKAGKFDYFLEQFAAYKRAHPEAEFLNWAEGIADYDKLNREFKPDGLADFINDHILHRE